MKKLASRPPEMTGISSEIPVSQGETPEGDCRHLPAQLSRLRWRHADPLNSEHRMAR